MKTLHPIPKLKKSDGTLKKIMTCYIPKTNYRRFFYNQAIPLLAHFANKQTLVLLFMLYNADSNNYVFCTYNDIMSACDIKDRSTVSAVLKDLIDSEAIIKTHVSQYLINPAISVQGNNEKLGIIASEFNSFATESKSKERKN